MPTETKNVFKQVALIIGATCLLVGASPARLSPESVIKSAEKYSLQKQRLKATQVIIATLPNFSNQQPAYQKLKKKLVQLAQFFYTDKGQQAYEMGKLHLKKGQYLDAVDKFREAEKYEGGNTAVLSKLTKAYLFLGDIKKARIANKKALNFCPFDEELIRDQLHVARQAQDWKKVQYISQILFKTYKDASPRTLEFYGRALVERGDRLSAIKVYQKLLKKEVDSPVALFWLSQIGEPAFKEKMLNKYLDVCPIKPKTKASNKLSPCRHFSKVQEQVNQMGDNI